MKSGPDGCGDGPEALVSAAAGGTAGAGGRRLRVGGIDYLNSRPLIDGLVDVAGGAVDLEMHAPSELARRLRDGRLDVALAPVAELLLAPAEIDYGVVPGIGISSYGPVESITLFHRAPLGRVRHVALDGSSMTSQLLTRLLFAARPDGHWRAGEAGTRPAPAFSRVEPRDLCDLIEGPTPGGVDADAVLLIGDAALRARPGPGWRALDLGVEWTRWTGLPFVYAVWTCRGAPSPHLAQIFDAARRRGMARIDAIVDRGPLPAGMTRARALRYLAHTIRFRLADAELDGLERFAALLGEHGLLGAAERAAAESRLAALRARPAVAVAAAASAEG